MEINVVVVVKTKGVGHCADSAVLGDFAFSLLLSRYPVCALCFYGLM